MKTMIPEYHHIDKVLADVVADVVGARGVPTGINAATELADSLYPDMLEARARLSSVERAALADNFSGVIVPDNGGYSMVSLRKLTYRASGLGESAPLTEITAYDEKTQTMATKRVAPYAMPDDEEIIQIFRDRMAAAMGRHARGASRDLVLATARANRMAWARELAGAENCGFCAMLASRGAVYSKNTVRFQAHDHCDCTATLVRNPESWPGAEQAIELRELWNRSKSLTEFTRKYRALNDMAT